MKRPGYFDYTMPLIAPIRKLHRSRSPGGGAAIRVPDDRQILATTIGTVYPNGSTCINLETKNKNKLVVGTLQI